MPAFGRNLEALKKRISKQSEWEKSPNLLCIDNFCLTVLLH
jgi:hypothetical protein